MFLCLVCIKFVLLGNLAVHRPSTINCVVTALRLKFLDFLQNNNDEISWGSFCIPNAG